MAILVMKSPLKSQTQDRQHHNQETPLLGHQLTTTMKQHPHKYQETPESLQIVGRDPKTQQKGANTDKSPALHQKSTFNQLHS